MTEALQLLHELRVLRGQCECGADLDMEQIQRMNALEDEVSRVAIDAPALLKTRQFSDRIRVAAISASGLEVQACPWIEVGDVVEISIDAGECSYRFKMLVSSCHEQDNGDLDATLAYIGIPLLLRRGPKSRSTAPSIEQIAA